MSLHGCHGMSGTDKRECYGMSGTGGRECYGMSGTEAGSCSFRAKPALVGAVAQSFLAFVYF
eukprot:3764920-Rhodomonas_salina.3